MTSTKAPFGELRPSTRFLLKRSPGHIFMKMELPEGARKEWPNPNAVNLATGHQVHLNLEKMVEVFGGGY